MASWLMSARKALLRTPKTLPELLAEAQKAQREAETWSRGPGPQRVSAMVQLFINDPSITVDDFTREAFGWMCAAAKADLPPGIAKSMFEEMIILLPRMEQRTSAEREREAEAAAAAAAAGSGPTSPRKLKRKPRLYRNEFVMTCVFSMISGYLDLPNKLENEDFLTTMATLLNLVRSLWNVVIEAPEILARWKAMSPVVELALVKPIASMLKPAYFRSGPYNDARDLVLLALSAGGPVVLQWLSWSSLANDVVRVCTDLFRSAHKYRCGSTQSAVVSPSNKGVGRQRSVTKSEERLAELQQCLMFFDNLARVAMPEWTGGLMLSLTGVLLDTAERSEGLVEVWVGGESKAHSVEEVPSSSGGLGPDLVRHLMDDFGVQVMSCWLESNDDSAIAASVLLSSIINGFRDKVPMSPSLACLLAVLLSEQARSALTNRLHDPIENVVLATVDLIQDMLNTGLPQVCHALVGSQLDAAAPLLHGLARKARQRASDLELCDAYFAGFVHPERLEPSSGGGSAVEAYWSEINVEAMRLAARWSMFWPTKLASEQLPGELVTDVSWADVSPGPFVEALLKTLSTSMHRLHRSTQLALTGVLTTLALLPYEALHAYLFCSVLGQICEVDDEGWRKVSKLCLAARLQDLWRATNTRAEAATTAVAAAIEAERTRIHQSLDASSVDEHNDQLRSRPADPSVVQLVLLAEFSKELGCALLAQGGAA